MNNDLIYVYCVSDNPPGLVRDLKTIGLTTFFINGFFIITKKVPESDFSEANFKRNLSDIVWLETNARDHIRVLNILMEYSNVIPFKFGTIFQTEENLKKFIADYSDSLTENFKQIVNNEEWSVKIYCDRNKLCKQIDELSEEAAALEKLIMGSSPGKAYLLKRKKTDLIENEMDRICKNIGQEYFERFKILSEATNLNNLLPKEFTGREDTMILNATFLICKYKVEDFRGVVAAIEQKDMNSGFFIEATGPWPPFSFISMKEK